MTQTIVHLVRHGEVFNPERVLYGRLPGYRLSSRGESQAARTAQAFAHHDVAHLVASPLQRAQETAQPFAELLGLTIGVDERLIEAGNTFEGLRVKGWRSQLWNPRYWPDMIDPTRPSWGEPYLEIADRMWSAVLDAREAAEGHEAILVSHQLPIVMVQRRVAGKRLAHVSRQCNLASVTSLVFEDENLVSHYYAEPAQEI